MPIAVSSFSFKWNNSLESVKKWLDRHPTIQKIVKIACVIFSFGLVLVLPCTSQYFLQKVGTIPSCDFDPIKKQLADRIKTVLRLMSSGGEHKLPLDGFNIIRVVDPYDLDENEKTKLAYQNRRKELSFPINSSLELVMIPHENKKYAFIIEEVGSD